MRSRPGRSLLAVFALLAVPLGCDSPTASRPGGPARVDGVSGDLQMQTVGRELPQPLVVRVLDADGRAMAGQRVRFSVTAGAGSVLAGEATTDAAGEARERWTLGTVAGDTQRVEAQAVDASGRPRASAIFRAVGRAGLPSSIAPAGPVAFTGLPSLPLADSVAAVVRDVFGNPVPGAAVVWMVRQGGGSTAPGTTVTDPTGVARTRWTLGPQLDSTQVIEAAAGLTLATQFIANGRVPLDAVLVKVSGDTQSANAGSTLPLPLVVRVQHADGRPIQGVPVTFTLPMGHGGTSPATAVSDTGGRVSATWTLGTAVGPMTATAGIATGSSGAFTATALAGAAASLQKVRGDNQPATPGAWVADSLVVRVVDLFGNPVAGAAVSWSSAVGSVSPATTVSRADGTAATRYTAGPGGTETVRATVAGAGSATFTVAVAFVGSAILSPAPNAVVGDDLRVIVAAFTSRPGDRILRNRVAVEDRVDSVFFDQRPPAGFLRLRGLAPGPKTLRFWVVTAGGDSVEVTRPITYLPSPVIEVSAPVAGLVVRDGQLRVDAACANCAALELYRSQPDGALGQRLAAGTTALHTSIDVSAYEGSAAFVTVLGRNAADEAYTRLFRVFVESSPRWSELASAGTRIRDVDATRVLYEDSAGTPTLKLRAVAGGAEETLRTPRTGEEVRRAMLFPQGALFISGISSADSLHEWRSGSSTSLGPALTVEVAGSWAAWVVFHGGGFRRDLTSGSTTALAIAINDVDVAENGDAVWRVQYDDPTSSSLYPYRYEIFRYHAGSTAPLTTGTGVSPWNVSPVTDGVNVLWTRILFSPSNQQSQLVRWSGGVETQLTPMSTATATEPHRDYEASGGWSAYTRRDASQIVQVWTIAPDGTERAATTGLGNARIAALAPNGDLVYTRLGRRWVARPPYSAAPVDVGTEAATHLFRGTDLFAFLGRSAFRVMY